MCCLLEMSQAANVTCFCLIICTASSTTRVKFRRKKESGRLREKVGVGLCTKFFFFSFA